MAQIQCPNCGGYKVLPEDMGAYSDKNDTRNIVLGLLTLGLWLIVVDIIARFEKPKPVKAGDVVVCRLCGYRWKFDNIQTAPAAANEELIRRGEARLKEERDRFDD